MPDRNRAVRRRALTATAAAIGVVWCVGTSGAVAATSDVAVLPCSTTPVTLGVGVDVVCSPVGTDGATVTSHVATVSLDAGAALGVVAAQDKVFQYVPGADAPIPDEVVTDMLPATASLAVNGGFFDIDLGSGAPFSGQACGGMVDGGRIIKTPPVGGTDPSQLVVTDGGEVLIGPVGFTGAVTDGADSTALTSVNDLSDAGPEPGCPPLLQHADSAGAGLTLVTPDMGPVSLPSSGSRDYRIPDAVVVTGTLQDATLTVTSVEPIPLLTTLPALTGDQVAFVASAAAPTTWLAAHARVGGQLGVSGDLTIGGAPRRDIATLLSGSAVLVHDGTPCPATGTPPVGCGGQLPPAGPHSETMVGVSRDGRTLQVVTVDAAGGSPGLDPAQDAPFLAALGAWNGILFDGGGSTTMAARTAPGAAAVLVNDTDSGETLHPPGPGNQRYVANALVVFPGAAPTPPVTSAPPPTPPKAAPVLAATGTAPLGLSLTAAGLVAVGGAVLVQARPRGSRWRQR